MIFKDFFSSSSYFMKMFVILNGKNLSHEETEVAGEGLLEL